jgi:hypothetical protein
MRRLLGGRLGSGRSSTASSASGTDGVYWSGNDADAYTLDLLCDSADVACSLDTTVGKELYRKFGIAFNYVGFSGDIKQQQSMMLAGQTYNEMMYLNENDIVGQYISAGAAAESGRLQGHPSGFLRIQRKIPPVLARRGCRRCAPQVGDHDSPHRRSPGHDGAHGRAGKVRLAEPGVGERLARFPGEGRQ